MAAPLVDGASAELEAAASAVLVSKYAQNRERVFGELSEPLGFEDEACSFCEQLLPFFSSPAYFNYGGNAAARLSSYLADARLECGHTICAYCLLLKTDTALRRHKFAAFLCCGKASPDLEYVAAAYQLAGRPKAAADYLYRCNLSASVATLPCARPECDGEAEQAWLASGRDLAVACDACATWTCRFCRAEEHRGRRCADVDLMNAEAEHDWANKLELALRGVFRCMACGRRIPNLDDELSCWCVLIFYCAGTFLSPVPPSWCLLGRETLTAWGETVETASAASAPVQAVDCSTKPSAGGIVASTSGPSQTWTARRSSSRTSTDTRDDSHGNVLHPGRTRDAARSWIRWRAGPALL